MDSNKNSLDARIARYNKHYGFLENPQKFSLVCNPHRLIVRNFALRNNRRDLYEEYIRNFYPEKAIKELVEFDSCLMYLKFLTKEEARYWFISNDTKVVESDIQVSESDAILRMLFVENEQDRKDLLHSDQSIVLNRVTPESILKSRDHFWIDTRIC
ncbi:hypothetical protein SF1_28260 [Sphingobacterium faecium NBRC 15299]|uniref:hypothetical protein n=1 Tax=Sphingobacterium faecium TaxID=34087 RepID=UPI000D371C39|nr:hypothetical protein [Sphingobacterium faecium]PTX13846.1 hypothetical protein C8N37_101599 [Sphingobacterium faecium]GEM64844.1 hypothetical protein SF1_28260 [Sphingobacterium faecium NBRC 15299]